MSTIWNPDLYLKFQKERTQPSIDLVNRIEIENPKKIIDVGCGPGNSTEILRSRWINSEIIGIDNSDQMIEKAKKKYPYGTWKLNDAMDIDKFGKFDIVFSNAVLQWIPNHEKLIPHLLNHVAADGVLAVQVPQNQFSVLHKALIEIADENEFKEYTQDAKKILNYRTGEYYYNLLCDSVKEFYMWETTYLHILENHEDLIEWYKSTGMKPFLQSLPTEALKTRLINKIYKKCKNGYKYQKDGKIIYPFNRLFFIGYKD